MAPRAVWGLAAACSIALPVLLSGCSSTSSAGGTNTGVSEAPPTKSLPVPATASANAASTQGLCTAQSIQASLPEGAALQDFQCALGSPYMWAVAREKPSGKVVFMRSNGGPWSVAKTEDACGRGPARSPDELITYCSKE